MKKFVIAASAIALAACNNNAEAPEAPEATETAQMDTAPAATGMQAGTYEVTLANGDTGTTRINADGTYTDMNPDGTEAASGTWRQEAGQTCFAAEGATEACWNDGPIGPDGSWTSTSPDGESVTIRPMAESTAM